jgi:hypothetical protein
VRVVLVTVVAGRADRPGGGVTREDDPTTTAVRTRAAAAAAPPAKMCRTSTPCQR